MRKIQKQRSQKCSIAGTSWEGGGKEGWEMIFEKLINIGVEMREKAMVGKQGDILYKVHKTEHNIYARNTEACKTEDVFYL